jgi:hypothetical protein
MSILERLRQVLYWWRRDSSQAQMKEQEAVKNALLQVTHSSTKLCPIHDYVQIPFKKKTVR